MRLVLERDSSSNEWHDLLQNECSSAFQPMPQQHGTLNEMKRNGRFKLKNISNIRVIFSNLKLKRRMKSSFLTANPITNTLLFLWCHCC